jgi:coenzyme F420-0:L-glutamate ligase/coenzyme F420-1:gamma-L-glutamate ligase
MSTDYSLSPSSALSVSLTALPGIPLVQPGDDVARLVLEGLARAGIGLADGDILVVAHKIISKAEGRLVRLNEVEPSERARELADLTGKDARYIQVVLDEAVSVERARRGIVVTEQRGGWVVANSAIDHSNVEPTGGEDYLVLLPVNPDGSARALRESLREATGATVAVIVNDTHGRPFRIGAIGVAIGVAGIAPLADLRGTHDLFGYMLQTTEIATADEIASAASMLQGQTAQGTPVVHIRGLPYTPAEEVTARSLQRPKQFDMFR